MLADTVKAPMSVLSCMRCLAALLVEFLRLLWVFSKGIALPSSLEPELLRGMECRATNDLNKPVKL